MCGSPGCPRRTLDWLCLEEGDDQEESTCRSQCPVPSQDGHCIHLPCPVRAPVPSDPAATPWSPTGWGRTPASVCCALKAEDSQGVPCHHRLKPKMPKETGPRAQAAGCHNVCLRLWAVPEGHTIHPGLCPMGASECQRSQCGVGSCSLTPDTWALADEPLLTSGLRPLLQRRQKML